jgi:hypothetical protein
MILEVAAMADTGKGRDYAADKQETDPAHELQAPVADTIDLAFGPQVFERWTEHVQAHVQLPDADGDGEVEAAEVAVPILEYGPGPNDYISTDIDAGQVVVRDGNDKTGRSWKYPLQSFYRFLAASQGKTLEGDEEEAKGPGMYEGAIKLQERTNKLRAAEREASQEATEGGRSTTATSVRAAADAKLAGDRTEGKASK